MVELRFTDAPVGRHRHWLLFVPSGVDVCLAHPGGEVDLPLSCTVRALTDVWMGHATWAAAFRAGAPRAHRPQPAAPCLLSLLELNPFAHVLAVVGRPLPVAPGT